MGQEDKQKGYCYVRREVEVEYYREGGRAEEGGWRDEVQTQPRFEIISFISRTPQELLLFTVSCVRHLSICFAMFFSLSLDVFCPNTFLHFHCPVSVVCVSALWTSNSNSLWYPSISPQLFPKSGSKRRKQKWRQDCNVDGICDGGL